MKQYILPFFVSTIAVFAPIHAIIVTVGVVILTDLITGILAARKRDERISSSALRRTISKIFVYETAILVGFLIETYLIGGLIPISKLAALLIGSVEAVSIFENLNTISGNNIFKSILDKLGSVNDKK